MFRRPRSRGLAFASGLWVVAAAPLAGQRPDTPNLPAPASALHGRITAEAERGGVPLAYALVEVRLASGIRSLLTDAEGRFRFAEIPPGPATVRAHYLGHRTRTLDVLVPARQALTLDLALAPEALEIPGLTVTAEPLSLPDPDGPGPLRPVTAGTDVELVLLQMSPGLAEMAVGPGAGSDGSDGGQNPADPSQVLLMRGSTADLKLVLLDGAPIYAPFHLGGLVESFDAAALGRAGHHIGGAPARYDGGLSYILDLETRRPGGERTFRGAVDMLSARASGEMSLGPAGVLASSRVLHNGGPRLLEGAPSPYGYVDGLLRASLGLPGEAGELAVTLFGNREEVRLGSDDTPLAPAAARWGNGLISTRLTHRLAGTALRWTAALSRYDAELPLRADTGSVTNPVLARGETGRVRLAAEAERPLGPGDLRFGASLDDMDIRYVSRLLTRAGVMRTDAHSQGRVLGAHAEVQRPLGPSVVGRLGGRLDHFRPGGTRSALRGSLAWSVTNDAVLSLTAGRYHQLTRAADRDLESALVSNAPARDGEADTLDLVPFLAVATGDHVVLGLDQRLGPGVELGMRGFVKRFTGVGAADELLTSSGVDLRLQAVSGGRTGWLGYALSWSWEGRDPGFAERFAGRHLLTMGFRGLVTGPFGLDVRLAFSDGLPYTEVPLATSPDADRVPTFGGTDDLRTLADGEPALAGDADGFLRLDLELYGEWNAPWAGGRGRIRPYLRLMNALDRRDALFYYFEPWRSERLKPLAERPVLPVLGLAWTF
jgi:hypothetical protein